MPVPYTRKIAETDVRIGNVILYKGIPTRVLIFHLQEIRAFSEDCEPVELNSEWLEKCGFEDIGSSFHDADSGEYVEGAYSLKLFKLDEVISGNFYESSYIMYNPVKRCIYLNSEEYKSSREFKYLHQLQNLYYSLTGEELPVNL